jgi:hypothetical protein
MPGRDRAPYLVERETAARDSIGSIELQEAFPAEVRHEMAAGAPPEEEHGAIAPDEGLFVRDAQREGADRSPLDFDVDARLCGALERLVYGDVHDGNDQPIAEVVDPPDGVDGRHASDNDALGAAGAVRERYRPALASRALGGPSQRTREQTDSDPDTSTDAHPSGSGNRSAARNQGGFVLPKCGRP